MTLINEAVEVAANRAITSIEADIQSSGGTLSRREEIKNHLTPEVLKEMKVTMADFENAIRRVQPTAKREG